jgi:hypothetical protein
VTDEDGLLPASRLIAHVELLRVVRSGIPAIISLIGTGTN